MALWRKVTTGIAIGGSAVTGAGVGIFVVESLLARKAIGVTETRPPSPDGLYGDDRDGTPVRVVVLGDSAAVGYGMLTNLTTPPALLGYSLAAALDGPVDIRSVAVVGAESCDLADQVTRALPFRADLAVILIGANDVTHLKSVARACDDLAAAVRRLRDTGTAVVVGTCPDLGTVRPLLQPLRAVARQASRRMARHQTVAVVEAGGRTVSLGGVLTPVFEEHHELMFGDDRFHPSASGYAAMIRALLPAVVDALADGQRSETEIRDARPTEVMPVAEAAHVAARRPGTEVRTSGLRIGGWAGVRRHR